MQLMADRFLRLGDGTVLDAASAGRVSWRVLERLDRPADEARWLSACGARFGLWHEHLPTLVDFGWLGGRSRFEAFAPAVCNLGARGSPGAWDFITREGAVYVEGAGRPSHDRRPRARRPSPSFGMRLLRRAAVERVAELFDEAVAGRPIVVGYVAEAGSGVTTFLRDVSREARARGFVPVDIRVLREWPELREALSGRHLLLIAESEETDGDLPERLLMHLALRSARGHVVLRPARRGYRELRVVLSPFPAAALAKAVHVWPPCARTARAIAAAAARSAGQPGLFLCCLRGDRGSMPALRVAEARAEYRVVTAPGPPLLAPDVAHWVRRAEEAAGLADRGRHAAARRVLDECSAALRRRGQSVLAAGCDVRSAELSLARGDTRTAEALFGRAYDELEETNDKESARAAMGMASTLVADAALERAEALLRAIRERRRDVHVDIRLAECLCWQARYDEAERLIAPALEHADPDVRVAALRVLGDIALGRHTVADAGRAASMALAEIDGRPVPHLRVAAHDLMVRVQGHVADLDAVRRHGSLGLLAARQARSPLDVLAVRLSMLDALFRCGERPNGRWLSRLDKLAAGRVPALTRARLWAVLSRVHSCERQRAAFAERIAAFVRATGARALDPALAEHDTSRAKDAAALVQLVSAEPEPKRLVEAMCEWLRRRLDAMTVAVFDVEGGHLSWCGRQGSFAAAARVVVSRQPIPPWLSDRGLEAAAPIEYGGQLQGVLCARWTIAAQPPIATTSILVTAAACAAPALHTLNERRSAEPDPVPASGIVGRSPAIARLHEAIRRAGASPFPVLIEGESGVGKELAARALHAGSARRSRPIVAVNCASFQDDLFEAELFGHARGAFTGAHAERPGLFEQADGGTLFLDEISELTPRAQAKLLRVLQEGEIRRLGENSARKVDVRVIAASNRPLADEAKAGRFRQDLLFRVAVIRLALPPLRERREDIPLIAAAIWREVTSRAGVRATLSAGAIAALSRYDWPGNVRELQNVLAALAVQVVRGRVESADVNALLAAGHPDDAEAETLEAARRRFERGYVAATLARCGGRHAEAARALGLTRQGLAKLMQRLALRVPEP